MGVTVEDKEVQGMYKNLGSLYDKTIKKLFVIALGLKTIITQRTLQGYGVNKKLSPYKPSTREYRRRRGLKTAPKTLSDHGTMLQSMDAGKTLVGADLFFGNSEETQKAIWQEDRGDEFFGIGVVEDTFITSQLKDFFDKEIK